MRRAGLMLDAVLAGMFVSIGGTVFLSVESRVVGALMFTVGLFAICLRGLALFTGRVCYAPDNDARYALSLPLIWLGNLVGAWGSAALIRLTRISVIAENASVLCKVKLSDSLLSVFILAVFCNILIYLAVDGYKRAPDALGRYLALFFGVVVFILCGFEHCVANMFYISLAGMWSPRAVIFILVNTLGNALGGILLPLASRVNNPPRK